MSKHAITSASEDLIQSKIIEVRGLRVILDSELAALYGVEPRALNQAVKRNPDRFPEAFRFVVTNEELVTLKSQSVISNKGRGGNRRSPSVFTEHGALMAATVLNSPRAVQMSLVVIRAFVELRRLLIN